MSAVGGRNECVRGNGRCNFPVLYCNHSQIVHSCKLQGKLHGSCRDYSEISLYSIYCNYATFIIKEYKTEGLGRVRGEGIRLMRLYG